MIREFNLSDINEIMDIWLVTNINVHDFISEKYWKDNYDFVKKSITDAKVYVYVNDKTNEIIGFIGLIDNYIAGLFVKENARSNGFGKALLDYAKSLKSKLTLDVYDKNNRAIQFYKREDFTVKNYNIDENTNEKECKMIWAGV